MDQKTNNPMQWVLASVETHIAIMQSALALEMEDGQVFILADTTSSRNPYDKEKAFDRLKKHKAEQITREMLFFEVLRDSESRRLFSTLIKAFRWNI
ncbi:isochorismatase family protein [Bartonella sp. DGB2]|uniref:isochorismatase family protein n=1 Tax=Bartonella sp. DGB2 TaxID=3388426 RepID=UPI00398FE2FF